MLARRAVTTVRHPTADGDLIGDPGIVATGGDPLATAGELPHLDDLGPRPRWVYVCEQLWRRRSFLTPLWFDKGEQGDRRLLAIVAHFSRSTRREDG